VDTFTDVLVEFDEPFGIMGLDVHEGIDAVVGLGILGKNVLDLIGVPQEPVDPALEHGIGENILAQGPVSGVEHADPFSQTSVEAVGTSTDHLKNLVGTPEFIQKRFIQGGTNRT